MKSLKQTYLINAPVKAVWLALVDPKIIDDWAGGPAKMDDKVGTKFSLWGGDIIGTNTNVIKEKELAQDWYPNHWKTPSKIVFNLEKRGDKTEVKLTQKNIPDDEFDEIEDGWKQYYLGAIKELLEK